jgi:hypothetical protein
MNLIELQSKVKEKEKKKNQLEGQKEMILSQLKELGFDSIEKAQEEAKKLQKQILNLEKKYDQGKELFIEKYNHLL